MAWKDEMLNWAPMVDQLIREDFFKVFKWTIFTYFLTPNIFSNAFGYNFCENFWENHQNIHHDLQLLSKFQKCLYLSVVCDNQGMVIPSTKVTKPFEASCYSLQGVKIECIPNGVEFYTCLFLEGAKIYVGL